MPETFLALAEDDIASMHAHLRLRGLAYIDFALEAEQRAALERWPLLQALYEGESDLDEGLP
jgi:hypothetical protein